MKEISLVNSELKIEVADEHFEAINVHRWYRDQDTGFVFRIVGDGGLEYLHNFISRQIAHWADED